jgi:hypothetical protein
MPKAFIGSLYILGFLVLFFSAFFWPPLLETYTKNVTDMRNEQSQGLSGADNQGYIDNIDIPNMTTLGVVEAIAGLLCTIAWVGMLVNLARTRSWTLFALAFFFSGIILLIYLFRREPIAQPAAFSQSQHGAPAQPLPIHALPYNTPVMPLQQQQPLSALEILQQRYARGEIDTATYEQIYARLKE